MRLKLTLAYDGTGFRGWARQPGERTVEASARRGARRASTASAGPLAVAGRTDTGVHALANVVSVDVDGGPPPSNGRLEALNARAARRRRRRRAPRRRRPTSTRASPRARARTATGSGARRERSPFEAHRSLWHPAPARPAAARGVGGDGRSASTTSARSRRPTTQHRVFDAGRRGRALARPRGRGRVRDHRRLVPAPHGAHARRHDARARARRLRSASSPGAPRSAAGPTAPPKGSTWSTSATRRRGRLRGALTRRRRRRRTTIGRCAFPSSSSTSTAPSSTPAAIILASMRHATRTVLSREIPDAELMAAVGGPGLEAADARVRTRRVASTSSSASTASTTSRCTTGCSSASAWTIVLVRLKDEGRRLGIVSAKRRSTVELAFATVGLGHLFDVARRRRRGRAAEAGSRPAAARARAPRRTARGRRLRRRLALRHGRREGRLGLRGRRQLGRHPRPRRGSATPT